MRKFLAVTKREYFKIVWTKTFIVSTILAPVFMIVVSFAPMLMMSLKGSAVRMVVVDPSGKIAARLRENLSPEKQYEQYKEATEKSFKKIDATQDEKLKNSAQQIGGNFAFEDYAAAGKTDEQIRQELNDRIVQKSLDAYLIVPPNYEAPDAKFEFFARNTGDFVIKEVFEKALEESVRSARLAKANISEALLKEINQNIDLSVTKISEKGEEKDAGFIIFAVSFTIGILIYVTLAIYGAAILQAIIEEKETRVSEVLFSSAKPFELMLGKLVGVGMAGLTQVGIWVSSGLILATSGIAVLSAGGMPITMPNISPLFIVYFLLYFLIGFFIYATIYALIGAMVTSAQEGQQFAFPPILILMLGFFSMFAVIRDPNSTFAFWVSVAPFTAPIVMPVRILIETPPFWQIALSLLLNILTILGLVWAAAKVYRIGMLMYGKRATVPEVWRWIWQK
jgi:ABC-2 type transport system permease protein